MRVDAEDGTVEVKLEEDFADVDAERIVEILESVAPFSELIVDFTDAYEFPDRSFPSFIQAIKRTAGTGPCVSFRGLTTHQSRLLKYLGLRR